MQRHTPHYMQLGRARCRNDAAAGQVFHSQSVADALHTSRQNSCLNLVALSAAAALPCSLLTHSQQAGVPGHVHLLLATTDGGPGCGGVQEDHLPSAGRLQLGVRPQDGGRQVCTLLPLPVIRCEQKARGQGRACDQVCTDGTQHGFDQHGLARCGPASFRRSGIINHMAASSSRAQHATLQHVLWGRCGSSLGLMTAGTQPIKHATCVT